MGLLGGLFGAVVQTVLSPVGLAVDVVNGGETNVAGSLLEGAMDSLESTVDGDLI